ncbi:MAG: hypothetical protein HDT02_03785 [Bacteroidales bacterium]|nr:hypothetical protein [Bacteroidales bacterium]
MKKFYYLILAGLLAGCTPEDKEPEPVYVENNPQAVSDGTRSNFVPLEDALKSADSLFSKLYGLTRSERKPVSTEIYGIQSRSDEDSMYGFYFVNYDNGFAILSADNRRDSVYAISNEGSVSISDTTYNRGLKWYVENELNPALSNAASVPVTPPITIDPGYPMFTYEETISVPLLSGMLRTMHQWAPYNKYTKTISGESAPVGCVPLAVGTIFAYQKWPTSLENINLNWSEMLSNIYDDRWAQLFYLLGDYKYLRVNYGVNGSGTSESYIVSTFTKCGYSDAKIADYSRDINNSELTDSRPMIALGQSSNGGHAWVIDGAYNVTTRSYQYPSYEGDPDAGWTSSIKDYLHMIWGGGTVGNGFYLVDNCTRSVNPTAEKLDNYALQGNFGYSNLRVVYGYKPKK